MAQHALRGGVDLGGTKIQTVVVDAEHQVLGQARRSTPTDGGPPDVMGAIEEAMREATDQAGVPPGNLNGVGIGAPGAIDEESGSLARAGNLPGWREAYPLASELGARLGTRVLLGNDVQVATDAEFTLGAGREFDSVLGVFWGTGVGGGIVLDRRPWLGRGAAGEIGHVVVKPHGAHCPCGRRGCMEAYAGRRAMESRARKAHDEGEKTILFKLMEERGRDRLTSGVWSRAIERGDELATRLVDEAVAAMGVGVASTCNVLDVDAVIIGGGMGVRFGEPYARRIMDAMMPHLFHDDAPPAMRVAELGDLGGALGGALLVVDAVPA
ncbi:MAG TPA: ROK family protein [Baekduia sp.]|uniref:ROK family protein n=1 Tax=Baekduia sp. TaxID=2600305 RepID=UPI002C69C41C|nr:ROK family protein [Baekduia sp.]HMJ33681.1 ROK family protein [Baekduia sp.]